MSERFNQPSLTPAEHIERAERYLKQAAPIHAGNVVGTDHQNGYALLATAHAATAQALLAAHAATTQAELALRAAPWLPTTFE